VVSGDAMYPSGTTEQFPHMHDTGGATLTDTAHYYMECSNKGHCDRDAGECVCFAGYEGSACQRASCPATKAGVCSGHGTCRSISDLATTDADNHYNLWDEDATLGCECDAGYTGPSCADRLCKYGFDPLYYDDEHTVRYSNFTFAIVSTYPNAGTEPSISGTFSLKFYDAHGEDWETTPITIGDVDGDAHVATNTQCDFITNALEAIPNDVIPKGSITCHYTQDQLLAFDATEHTTAGVGTGNANKAWEPIAPSAARTGVTEIKVHSKFILAFPSNPGYLKQPEINMHLDGDRPSLYTDGDDPITWVYPNGFQGEDVDYVPDLCAGVRVTLDYVDAKSIYKLAFEDAAGADAMQNLFKTCLGEADANTATIAMDIYQWDYGTVWNPHLIKLVDTTTELLTFMCADESSSSCARANPPGFYAVTYFDTGVTGDDAFYVFNRAGDDYIDMVGRADSTTIPYFNVFTTTGTLQIVSEFLQGITHFHDASDVTAAAAKAEYASYYGKSVYTFFKDSDANSKTYDISCESYTSGRAYGAGTPRPQLACLEKGDLVMMLNTGVVTKHSTGNGVTKDDAAVTGDVDWNTGGIGNAKYLNMYRVAKVGRDHLADDSIAVNGALTRNKITFEQSINAAALYDNGDLDAAMSDMFRIYKFTPPTTTLANTYAAECSTRGVCNREDGVCECFGGYTGDNCSLQNALAE